MEKNDGDFAGEMKSRRRRQKIEQYRVAEFSASLTTKYVDLGPLTFLAVLR